MVEVRTDIWDYLYKNGPTPLKTIAEALGQSQQTIEAAVDHEWFTRREHIAAIAMHEATRPDSRGKEPPVSEEKSSQILRNLFSSGD